LMKVAWCWRLRNYHHPYKQLLCGHAPCTVDLCRGTSSMHYSFLSISSVYVCVDHHLTFLSTKTIPIHGFWKRKLPN
jgi:hypothetical protein